jgi:asparagine synthase (glutamine-hydrolysing)
VCGFAGFIKTRGGETERLLANANAMADAISHRGPDDSGAWSDSNSGFAVAHRRLSIIDLSREGHQPMISASGRFVAAYNGEVYNFRELRSELEALGNVFRGTSDTEVVLAAWDAWGGPATAKRLNGMFALAVWDTQDRVLTLVRDRLGIKPLYWGQFDGAFLFGSDLSALSAHPDWRPKLNRHAATAYFRYAHIPGSASIYDGVSQLSPGTFLTIGSDNVAAVSSYWDLGAATVGRQDDRAHLSDEDAITTLESKVDDSVRRQMVADVPVGAFLSGGIDSSLVVAHMQSHSPQPVHTFTIGFREEAFSEASYARTVAEQIGTKHTELFLTSADVLENIQAISSVHAEPFADPSQIPTYFVSELARTQVKVVLSGDGGDELFGGYNRHLFAARYWPWLAKIPFPLRAAIMKRILAVPPRSWNRIGDIIKAGRSGDIGDAVHKFANALGSDSSSALYRGFVSRCQSPENLLLNGLETEQPDWEDDPLAAETSLVDRMRYLDTRNYLSGDILTKVDRASMAHSLETRVPLLDHGLLEFAWSLSPRQLIRRRQSKWLMRQALLRQMPAVIANRHKMGFDLPLATWLRGPLRDWAESLLSEKALSDGNILNPAPVREIWSAHLSGRRNMQNQLWSLLMFQMWFEKNQNLEIF